LAGALPFIPITWQFFASAVIPNEPLSCANRSTDIDSGEILVLSTNYVTPRYLKLGGYREMFSLKFEISTQSFSSLFYSGILSTKVSKK
jgi:hypothetical protein